MSRNRNLREAKRKKKDDFYTQLSDIEKELRHYTDHFRDKVVYCNCDDPRVSNFYKYFSLNFEHLGLKKLITTCYKNQHTDSFSDYASEKATWLECNRGTYKDGAYIPSDPVVQYLNGDGDFRSEECIELLKQVDIVVTNPPFSLFREYVAQLVQYGKKFLIVGSQNAVTYKEVFPLIKDNTMWLGVTPKGQDMLFDVPESYAQDLEANAKEGSAYRIVEGVIKGRLGNAAWFTNLDYAKRHEELILYRRYSADEYPSYDNYDAINVDKAKEIPKDWDGVMGVPITFLDKYNPDQFEMMKNVDWGSLYNAYKDEILDPAAIEAEAEKLDVDDDVTNKAGIYPYILTRDEKYLNIRKFSKAMRQKAYGKQAGKCPACDNEFDLAAMDADHIDPWIKGGKTNEDNCQMLCKPCNRRKSAE